ncbi:hypothetical protein C0993_001737 [Termitomyces sp. T159_Od127]|nr:hypothetical protein C0993_001737 [Termitomyces sp. T159_Od127]
MTTTSETQSPATSAEPDLAPKQIKEMCCIDNLVNPLVLPVEKVMAIWTGHILDKDDGRWANWLYNMGLKLSMVQ